MEKVLDVKSLVRRFGRETAVDDVSFSLKRGEVLGFLGPNGAGKSTTMRMITGFLPPGSGRAVICGHDIERAPLAAKARIGYLPEGAPLYGDMTPAGVLDFVARARGIARAERRRRIASAVERLELENAMDRPIETLSKGFRRRVGLAQAILHDPDLLILDEPTDGLDPNQKHQVRTLLKSLAKDKAIIISTHILEEVEPLCTRCIVLTHGRIVADDTPQGLLRRSRRHGAITIAVPAERMAALRLELARVPEVAFIEETGGAPSPSLVRLRVLPRDGARIADTVRALLTREGVAPAEFWSERGELDEVFRRLTRHEDAPRAKDGERPEAGQRQAA